VSFGAGSRPEDKAGACLTRIIRLAESSAATVVLSSFGWPSLPAGQLLGPTSIAARAGQRYSGSGAATWPGGTTQFPRVRIDVSGKVIGHDYATKARLSVLAVPFGSDLYPQIDCGTGTLTSSSAIVSFSNGTETCYLPTTVPTGAGCLARGGRIRLGPAGASVGAVVRLDIEDVPFVCGTSAPVRATIHAEAKLSDETQDGVGLHPLLSIADAPTLLGTARPGVTVKDLVAKLQPWAEELAAAAELCDQAAAQNANFRAPGALWAGDDLPLTRAISRSWPRWPTPPRWGSWSREPLISRWSCGPSSPGRASSPRRIWCHGSTRRRARCSAPPPFSGPPRSPPWASSARIWPRTAGPKQRLRQDPKHGRGAAGAQAVGR
jgi:hypothetical protein